MMYLCRYPIYRIPTGPTLKDLDACFLTYHFLYTPVGGKKQFQSSNLELRGFFFWPTKYATYKQKQLHTRLYLGGQDMKLFANSRCISPLLQTHPQTHLILLSLLLYGAECVHMGWLRDVYSVLVM